MASKGRRSHWQMCFDVSFCVILEIEEVGKIVVGARKIELRTNPH